MNSVTVVGATFLLALFGAIGTFMPWLRVKGHELLGVDGDGLICLVALAPVLLLAIIGLMTKGLARGSAIGVAVFGTVSTAITVSIVLNTSEYLSGLDTASPIKLTEVIRDGLWLTLGTSAALVLIGLLVVAGAGNKKPTPRVGLVAKKPGRGTSRSR